MENYEPVEFPLEMDTSVNVNIWQHGDNVNLSYENENEAGTHLVTLQLTAKDAVEFAQLILKVASDIMKDE